MRKDIEEKLKEARAIVLEADASESADFETACLTGAGVFLLQEVDRLGKIVSGVETLIEMKRQAHEALYQQAVIESANEYYHGPNGVVELLEKAEILRGEIKSLEALFE